MKRLKLDLKNTIEIGSVVKYKCPTTMKVSVGEVVGIIGQNIKYEVILYDMRLKPIVSADARFKRKTWRADRCKLIDEKFYFTTNRSFELGDVIHKTTNFREKFGVIVGFLHPDGLYTTSYEHGYNGTDLLECVEINKRGLRRKRDILGKVKRFTTANKNIKICDVDLWNTSGPKIIIKK